MCHAHLIHKKQAPSWNTDQQCTHTHTHTHTHALTHKDWAHIVCSLETLFHWIDWPCSKTALIDRLCDFFLSFFNPLREYDAHLRERERKPTDKNTFDTSKDNGRTAVHFPSHMFKRAKAITCVGVNTTYRRDKTISKQESYEENNVQRKADMSGMPHTGRSATGLWAQGLVWEGCGSGKQTHPETTPCDHNFKLKVNLPFATHRGTLEISVLLPMTVSRPTFPSHSRINDD